MMPQLFSNHNVIVKESGIEGLGVFANRDFKEGETFIEWNPDRELTKQEVEQLPFDERKCTSQVGPDHYVIISVPGRYVNHSCNANTRSENLKDIAARDIRKDEEITADYRTENVPVSFTCHCGSANCIKEYSVTSPNL